jgi:predicted Zn-dependent protease
MMKKRYIYLNLSVMIAIIALICSCAVNPVTGKRQLMLMSEAQEIQMGKEYDPQVIASFGEYKNDKLLAFVQGRGTEMGKISHRPNLEYHLRVLDSPVINAFAVPGGYIYLTRGILAQLNNEAELVGIIGHEMGHIAARHTVSRQSKQQLGQLILIGGMVASEKFANYAQYAMQGMQLLFLSFSREDERQADRLGVEYSSKIDYDAHKMADFFKILNKMSLATNQAGIPTFLSTHPDPGDRYNDVNRQAGEWQDSLKYPTWKINGNEYLKLIDGIIYGEDPRQGYKEGNVFYHPELKFRFAFPAGWALENSPLQVTMAPEDGKAMIIFSMSQQKTPDEAAQITNKELKLILQSSKNITVNGLPATATVSKQVTQNQTTGQQQTNMIMSYYINYNGLIYVFHGVSTEADFNTYMSMLESSMASFAKLTDASKINVKPKKIMVKAVQKSGTLSEFLLSHGMPQGKLKELALLNDMELTDKLQTGKLIKIIGE